MLHCKQLISRCRLSDAHSPATVNRFDNIFKKPSVFWNPQSLAKMSPNVNDFRVGKFWHFLSFTWFEKRSSFRSKPFTAKYNSWTRMYLPCSHIEFVQIFLVFNKKGRICTLLEITKFWERVFLFLHLQKKRTISSRSSQTRSTTFPKLSHRTLVFNKVHDFRHSIHNTVHV